jgi:o-succinylbenzoate---CoA ligase
MSQMLASSQSGSHNDQAQEAETLSRIWINGRHVYMDKILHDREPARSEFEEATFSFIRDWVSGEENFELTTSGSTGKPKTISLSRYQMMVSARRTADKINLQKNSRALICLDPRFIAGKMMLARCLTLGIRIMALDPTANPLTKIPVDKCVQFTAFVPYQVQAVLESKHPHLLNNLDKVLIGGAPLSQALHEQLDIYQCECYETYGMTETVSHIALRLVNTKLKQPYFETLPGIQISLDDRGCLVISADYLPEPVVTNDLAEIIGEGKFLWSGRWDTVINTGGVKVMPEKVEKEVEAIFRKNNLRHRFFIAALPDEKLGQKVVLVLEGVQFSSELINQSLMALRSVLSPYEVPKEVYSIPQFVTTETQKIDRNQTLPEVTFLLSFK